VRDMKALIFDLDQTLVDTQHIEPLRRTRKWGSVFQKIPTIIAYEGIDDVLSVAREKGVKLAIVSSSPSNYVQKIIHHFKWSFDEFVCYHDSIRHKPYPDPFIEVLNRLNLPSTDCWAVGDDPKDIIAAGEAKIFSVGALWGSLDKEALVNSKPDITFEQ